MKTQLRVQDEQDAQHLSAPAIGSKWTRPLAYSSRYLADNIWPPRELNRGHCTKAGSRG